MSSAERRGLPTFVALPHVMYNVVKLPGQVAGFLGSAHDPFQVASDPNAPDFRLDELELPGDVSLDRLEPPRVAAPPVDDRRRSGRGPPRTTSTSTAAKAFRLLRSEAVRRAFRLDEEDPRLRDRYGRTKHGQSLLLARRLVEAGVRFVTVYDHEHNGQLANWDAHAERLRPAQGRPAPAGRPGVRRPDRGPDRPRPARLDAGDRAGRVRPHPEDQRPGGPRPLARLLQRGARRRRGPRRDRATAPATSSVPIPIGDGVTPGDLAATLFWRFGLEPDRRDPRPVRAAVSPGGRPAAPCPVRGLTRRSILESRTMVAQPEGAEDSRRTR